MRVFFFSSRRRHTRCGRDWSSDVCSSDLKIHLTLLALCATFAFAAFSTKVAGSGIIRFQESSGLSSENSSGLIGHWRKTTIGYTGPIDEHLVLHSNGTVENWTVTAYERREPVTGNWS